MGDNMDWLFKEDNYEPPRDRETFLNKSTLSLMKILSRIRDSHEGKERGFTSKVNPVLKFASTIILILIISISIKFSFIIIIDEIILLSIITMNKEGIKRVLTLSMAAVIFSAVILAPSILMGNDKNSIMIILKVFGTVSLMGVLSYSTKWNDITKSLRMFFIPDIFIFVLDLTIRYIFILSEMAADMILALKLKSIGKNSNKYSSMSNIAGNLFLKSKVMGEETLSAMECRGFTGEYKGMRNFRFSKYDFIYSVVVLGLIFAYFMIGRV